MFFLSFFLTLILFFAFFVISAENPIICLFSLILCILLSSVFLIYFEFIFFAIVFISIYIGAIAIFFLFIIMFISGPSLKNSIQISKFFFFFFLFFFLFFFFFYFFFSIGVFSYSELHSFLLFFPLEQLGLCFYNYAYLLLIFLALLLYIALLGAILIFLE